MRIMVLIKEVPDTYGERVLNLETGLAERNAGDVVLDEIGERALEVALSFADTHPGTEVIVLSMGPGSAQKNLRKALAMGANSAVHVADETLRGADLGLTAQVLAAAVRRTGFDLVITGNQSTDGGGGVIPSMLAEHLGVPHATALSAVEISDSAVRGTRSTENGDATVSAPLPAVISVTDALPDPRLPNFKGIMAAKKKPIEMISLGDLGVSTSEDSSAWSIIVGIGAAPTREAGIKIIDDGDAGEKLADFLLKNRLA